ncbi:sensor domain-containing protein [Mycolicibacterium houstonense]|uniref:sensor domain-containing protein n=1 Tax=Mycolicibacterium houstonense TaxID=146021 RepID=UPI00093E6E5A|nr:sensor domain-containing protein [Mycolicibacterium houstonense]
MTQIRTAASCLALLLATACATGSGETTPSSSPSPRATPIVLSINDVRAISQIQDFRPEPDWDLAGPSSDPNTPEPCRSVYDDVTVFGSGTEQFRTVAYGAVIKHPLIPGFARITQTVAVYPDRHTAEATFDSLRAAVPHCVKAGIESYDAAVRQPDESTILLDGRGGDTAYRLTSSTVFSVSSLGLTDDDRVALAVLDQLQQAQP